MVQTQSTIPASRSYAWLGEVARAIRVTAILLLLMGWFVVVGTLAAVTVVRDAVIHPS